MDSGIYASPQQKCIKCGFSGYESNEWCAGHPVYMVSTQTGWCTSSETFYPLPEVKVARGGIRYGVPDDRPDWDDVWMDLADNIARRSKCTRSQVGAVIVDAEQNVVSVSYNGPPRGFKADGPCTNWCPRTKTDDLSPTYDDCPSAHAEANAIARADYTRMKGATLYASTSCCKGCAKQIANSGIVRVMYRNEQGRDYRNPEATHEFFEQCGIEVDIYED